MAEADGYKITAVEEIPSSPSASKFKIVDEEPSPGYVRPEVQQAIGTVKPPVPSALRPAPATPPAPAPRPLPNPKLIQALPGIEVGQHAAEDISNIGEAAKAITTGGPTRPIRPPALVRSGAAPIAPMTPEENRRAEALAKGIQSGFNVATPAMLAAGAAAPLAGIESLVAGYAASKGTRFAASRLGASPEMQDLAEQVGWLITPAGLIDAHTGLEVTPEGFRGAVTALGGRAGVGVHVSPEEIRIRGGVGPFRGEKVIPREGSAGPAIEPPTINATPPDRGAQAIVSAGNRRQQAARVAQGLPPVEPPPPAPVPEPQPHLAPEDVQDMGEQIAKLPPDQRAQAMIDAHDQLTQHILQQGKIVTPDGKLQVVENEKQAAKIAQDVINQEVERQDRVTVENSSAGETSAEISPKKGVRRTRKQGAEELAAKTPVQEPTVEPKIVAEEEIPNEAAARQPGAGEDVPNEVATGNADTSVSQPTEPVRGTDLPATQAQVSGTGSPSAGTAAPAQTPQKFEKGAQIQVAGSPATVKHDTVINGQRTLRVKFDKPTKLPWTETPVTSTTIPKKYHDSISLAGASTAASNAQETAKESQIEATNRGDIKKGEIVYARHGATRLDQEGGNETVAGWSKEPLDERGIAAANQMAGNLKGSGVTSIVASDLPRAKQTAEIVGKSLGLPVKTDERLRPQRMPETEGKKVKDIQHIREHYKAHPDEVPPGGESFNQFRARQDAALAEVEQMAGKGEKPLVVTHSTNLEAELGKKPEPGGIVTKNLGTEGGSSEPAHEEAGKVSHGEAGHPQPVGEQAKPELKTAAAPAGTGTEQVEKPVSKEQPIGPTPESRAASEAAFQKNYPSKEPPAGLTGDALRAWQESIGNPLPKEVDIGSKVRAANPEPTRAEVKAAAGKKDEVKQPWQMTPAEVYKDLVAAPQAMRVGRYFGAGGTGRELTDTDLQYAAEQIRHERTEPVHSISITPEMKKSVMEEGQPLFHAFFPSFGASAGSKIEFSQVLTKEGLPPYLRVNDAARQAISRALNINFLGVNLDKPSVQKISAALRTAAATAEMNGGKGADKAVRQLSGLADAMEEALDKNPKAGVNIVRTGEGELKTAHEELLHSVQRKAGEGWLPAGVPWKEVLKEPGMARMAAERIVPQLQRAGLDPHPAIIVAEGMVDILRGDAAEDMGPMEAFKTAEKYFEAALQQHGIEHLKDFQSVQDYIREREEALNAEGRYKELARSREEFAVQTAGQAALSRVLSRATGGKAPAGRVGIPEKAIEGQGETGIGSGGAGAGTSDLAGTGREGLTPATERPLYSTQPVGLTDEELEDWSKSKGFRYEPAGEQLGIFGGNDQLLRVFRSGPRGREQRGLIYQNQLDRLQESAKAEPTEPFSLTASNAAEEEQPRLFGAGDLGEIIGNPQGEKPKLPSESHSDFSLFSGEHGTLEPGKLGEAAQAVAGYLHHVRDFTEKARNLERGLDRLDTQKQADILRAVNVMKDAKAGGYTHEDDESIYHHLEDPEGVNLSEGQDKWLDEVIMPIAERNSELYTELTDGGVPIENYVHRVVKGKGGMLDRIAQGVKSIGTRGTLSKSAPQTKHRAYMVLEKEPERGQGSVLSRPGERVVVSIKGGQVTAWRNGEPENLGGLSSTEEGKAFVDKDNNLWTLRQATTKEIESSTSTVYFHSALASTVASNIQLESAVRAMRFLEAFKSSPEFKEVAMKQGAGNPPTGWRTTNLPQFHGYFFEPRTADVLDKYYDRMRQGNLGALDQIGHFMRVAILLSPIQHPLNVAASWAMEKGAVGLLSPTNFRAAWKAGNKAIKAVLEKNQDFVDALDAGAPLQSHREAIKDITKLFFDQLAEGLQKEESWAMKTAKALGIEHGNLLNLIHKFSSKVAWAANDILFLQSAYEHQAKGMSLPEALKETGRIIPEYRVPSRILDSPALSKLMTNRWFTIFGSYHYGLLRAFSEVAKSALGAQEPAEGRTKAQEIAKGWDRLLMLGLVSMVLYPLMDEAARELAKDKHARARRVGPFGLIDLASDVATKQQSPTTAIQRVITPAPQTKAAAELVTNRDFFSGRNIFDPHASYETQGQQIGHYLIGQLGQLGQLEKAQTTEQKNRFWLGQAGVSIKKSPAEKLASDIAISKTGTEAEDPADQDSRVLRREVLEQLRKGNTRPLREAMADGELTQKQVQELERRSRLTPLQDTVHGFSYSEIMRVNAIAEPEEREQLAPLIRQKRMNLLRAGRGREVTTANP